MRALHAAHALLLLVGAAVAHAGAPRAWAAADLPSPHSDPGGVCGRAKPSALCDPDGVLSADAGDVVDGIANFIHAGSHGFTKVDCGGRAVGAEVAVAVVRRRKGSGGVGEFARELHDAWGVGDARCNTGVVLVVVLEERVMWISTGAGVKALLTDNAVQAVLSDMKKALRAGRVDVAIQTGVADIGHVLAGASSVGGFSVATGSESMAFSDMLAIGGVLGFFALVARAARTPSPRDRYRRCAAALRRLDADRALARSNVLAGQTSCPICLEDFARRSPTPSPATPTAAAPGPVPPGVRLRASAAAASSTTEDADGEETVSLVANGVGSSEAATEGTAGEAASSSGDLPDSEQALRCGHKFHRSCLTSMLQHGTSADKCPVCRRPMFGPDPAARRAQPRPGRGDEHGPGRDGDGGGSGVDANGDMDLDLPSGRAAGGDQNAHDRGWNAFYPEYMFRLNRLQFYYPQYVTGDMVDRWGREDYAQPLAADVQFRALEPPVVEQARHAGSGGASFSFGGGSSMGGGGGGSSW